MSPSRSPELLVGRRTGPLGVLALLALAARLLAALAHRAVTQPALVALGRDGETARRR
jgi:hypothetical protein